MKLSDPFEIQVADSNPSMFDEPEKTSFFKHIEFGDLYRSIPECRASLFKYLQMFRASGSLVLGGTTDNIIKNIQERNEKSEQSINKPEQSISDMDFTQIEPENLKKATGMLKHLCGENESLSAVFDSIGDEINSFTQDQDDNNHTDELDEMSESDKAQLSQVSELMKKSMNMDDKTINKMMKMASNVAKKIGNTDSGDSGFSASPDMLKSIQQGLGSLSMDGLGGILNQEGNSENPMGGLQNMMSMVSNMTNQEGDSGSSENPMGGIQNMMSSMVSNMTNQEDAGAGIANFAKMLAKNSQGVDEE